MALRCLKLLQIIRSNNFIRSNLMSTSIVLPKEIKILEPKTYKTENNLVYLEDPETFGNLTGKVTVHDDKLEDEDDLKEQEFQQNIPFKSQKLTTRQYADLIKQYLKHKRLKEAIDILEVRILKEDRAKPENYIYNILIGACADVGYTKKAFKLYNDMKKRGLKATGDTYTCLFHACANSPWPLDGLKNAQHLRTLMSEKGIEPNLTNYNAMIKAFGRCGDLSTAFQIVDEMRAKNIKIRVHTFNHLLHACISDKNTGLRHALIVWRKMLKMREKPNIYSFNLMLKCVKECNLGTKENINELLGILEEQLSIDNNKTNKILQITASKSNSSVSESDVDSTHANLFKNKINEKEYNETTDVKKGDNVILQSVDAINSDFKTYNDEQIEKYQKKEMLNVYKTQGTELAVLENKDKITIQFIDNINKLGQTVLTERTVPNLLSKELQMQDVLSLQEVHTVQDKFAVVGGQEDFFKEMEIYAVKPDIKVFTQMISLLEETREAENKLIETMNSHKIIADIDFYNLLIKKRCMRSDYDGALELKQIIEEENKRRKKKYPLKKKRHLKMNIMTYGVLAMTCNTKESAEKLLNEMKENQLKINIEILGTLLKHGTVHSQFKYILYIMNIVKEDKVNVNEIFFKHLEAFNEKCVEIIKQDASGKYKCTEKFLKGYNTFLNVYKRWLTDLNLEDVLKTEHPWMQFKNSYPETVQRQNIKIIEPKRFYKRNRKYVHYTPKM